MVARVVDNTAIDPPAKYGLGRERRRPRIEQRRQRGKRKPLSKHWRIVNHRAAAIKVGRSPQWELERATFP